MAAVCSSAVAPRPPPSQVAAAAATPPLRRAIYVSVEQLVRSQYEINVLRLKEELDKQAQAAAEQGAAPAPADADAAPDGSAAADGGGEGRLPDGGGAASHARSRANLSVLPGGPLGAPLRNVKHHHQSRLQPPRDGANLCLRVGRVELVVDKCRVDGSRVLVAEVEVGDATGAVSLRARDGQIDLLRRAAAASGAVVLRNCTVGLYMGRYLRLAVSKWGKMTVYPDGIVSTPPPPPSLNRELNFSLVDLNLVAVTKLPAEPPVPVATVHQAHQKQHQRPLPKHGDYSPSRGGMARNHQHRGGGGGGGGGRGVGHYAHQKKKKDDWHQQQQHNREQPPYLPHSGSHDMSAGGTNQYLLQHQDSAGSVSPPGASFYPQMHYQQQYSDAGSPYPYPPPPPPLGDPARAGGPPPTSPHRPPPCLPPGHYERQHHLLCQQYELQAQHAQQLEELRRQQESQRRLLEHHQARSSLVSERGRGPGIGDGAPGVGGAFPPPSPHVRPLLPPPPPPPMSAEFQYGAPPLSLGHVFPGEGGGPHQIPPPRGAPTYAMVTSSPSSSPPHTKT